MQLAAWCIMVALAHHACHLAPVDIDCHMCPAVEQVSAFDVECMYNLLTVGLEYPDEVWRSVHDRHGHEPRCSVGVGRHGF